MQPGAHVNAERETMSGDRRTGEVTRNAGLAFVFALLLGVVLANLVIPDQEVLLQSVNSGAEPVQLAAVMLPEWVQHLGKLSKAFLIFAIGFTLLLLWNFLFQVANPDSMVRRRLDQSDRLAKDPLPHADELPLEGD